MLRVTDDSATKQSGLLGLTGQVKRHVTCPNFFKLHANTKRRHSNDPHWYYLTGKLKEAAETLGFHLPTNAQICMECRLHILAESNCSKFG
ncbi:unnamed protein product, partial [Allacma fusca]